MLLKGIKILDLSTLLPGPMCSLFLADLGADVIKIESPKGDLMRNFDSSNHSGKSPYFAALNRNKKSMILDLKTGEDRKKFMMLAKKADVIIEGFRPGKAVSLGIGYQDVKKVNSGIIYCSISGYGQKGALRDRAGHDINYSSLSGLLDVMSDKPFVPGVQFADVGCALVAAFSILAAMIYREKTGKGNHIDVPIFNSALSLIGIHIAQSSASKDLRTVLSGSKPCYGIYETKDKKHVSLGAIERKFWESFCSSVKRKDLLKRQFDETAVKDLKEIFRGNVLSDWVKLNKKEDFCCEPVRSIKEVVNDTDLSKRRVIIRLDGIKQAAFPASFSSAKKLKYTGASKLGEHNKSRVSVNRRH